MGAVLGRDGGTDECVSAVWYWVGLVSEVSEVSGFPSPVESILPLPKNRESVCLKET
jgi:hypothetical protein